jgi:ribosomal protein L1
LKASIAATNPLAGASALGASTDPSSIVNMTLQFDTRPISVAKRVAQDKNGSVNPWPVALPHSWRGEAEDVSICLIVRDNLEAAVRDAKLPSVTRVIAVSDLRKELAQYEDQRRLVSSYDLFLADHVTVSTLSRTLGKTFLKRKRQPLPIRLVDGKVGRGKAIVPHELLDEETAAKATANNFVATDEMLADWRAKVTALRDGTQYVLTGVKAVTVKVATVFQSEDQIVENCLAVLRALDAHMEKMGAGGLDAMTTLNLGRLNSIPLPMMTERTALVKQRAIRKRIAAEEKHKEVRLPTFDEVYEEFADDMGEYFNNDKKRGRTFDRADEMVDDGRTLRAKTEVLAMNSYPKPSDNAALRRAKKKRTVKQ